jgi:valacyclovir hydrolase
MPFVDLPTGARLHYEEHGKGEPLVALHGMLGTPQTHLDGVIQALSQHYRVIAPTLRGYGQSTPKPRDFPTDFYRRDALDVLAFLDALKIHNAHLIGYSDGGEITLLLAGMANTRFRSAAAWGAVGYFSPALRDVPKMLPATWITTDDQKLHDLKDPEAFARAWLTAFHDYIDRGGDVSLSSASNIECPLLIMLGVKDTLNPESAARQYLAQVKRGQLRMFNTGHAIHQEQSNEFMRELLAFLQANSAQERELR